MDRIGPGGVMAARAQAVARDDPAFATVLVEERKSGLFFFRRVQPEARPTWEAYYALWARIVPDDPERSLYRLEYMRYTNRWQSLDFVGSLEECVREIGRDSWGVFFGPPGPPTPGTAPQSA
jgi:hypothetical protein